MSDSKLNFFLAVGTAADMATFTPSPPTPAAGPAQGYLFFQTDTGNLYAWNPNTMAWVQVNITTSAAVIFADLPAAPFVGQSEFITDGLVTAAGNFGAAVVIGGGLNSLPLYWDGATWRIG